MTEKKTNLKVPETLEGWAILHQILRVNWADWKLNSDSKDVEMLCDTLREIGNPKNGQSAVFSIVGHKGDLLFLHFRKTLEELNEIERILKKLQIFKYMEETTSYVSFLELGLYEMTLKLYRNFIDEGMEPGTQKWNEKWKMALKVEKERMQERLYMNIPDDDYLCFYPMNKKRGEVKNWYALDIQERQALMREHGFVGRKYAGKVKQIITGSIGFDDWEWGVYLFSEDPLVFKKLIYEMRFDEASIWYAEFGPFYIGLRKEINDIPDLFLS
ncbi:MAG: hydrogen peroxide-dependent heme synthase [Nitrospinota bacterium]|nr:hydrogen peroxide-dependent heme synthase [Nitrospinota bacterium]